MNKLNFIIVILIITTVALLLQIDIPVKSECVDILAESAYRIDTLNNIYIYHYNNIDSIEQDIILKHYHLLKFYNENIIIEFHNINNLNN